MEILTNGALITPELLESLTSAGIKPLMMISFDGIGRHDWMRGVPGAEEKALKAIRLCREAGLPVSVHICIHENNVDVIDQTVKMLSDMDVNVLRVI